MNFIGYMGRFTHEKDVTPELVITEDSNSGYQFFDYVCRENHLRCEAMNWEIQCISLFERA